MFGADGEYKDCEFLNQQIEAGSPVILSSELLQWINAYTYKSFRFNCKAASIYN